MKIQDQDDLMVYRHPNESLNRIVIFQCRLSDDGYWQMGKNGVGESCYFAVPGSIVVVNNEDFNNPITVHTGRSYFEYDLTVSVDISRNNISILNMYPKLHLV